MGMYDTIGSTAMMLWFGLVLIIALIALMDEKPKIFDKIKDKIFESIKAFLLFLIFIVTFFTSCILLYEVSDAKPVWVVICDIIMFNLFLISIIGLPIAWPFYMSNNNEMKNIKTKLFILLIGLLIPSFWYYWSACSTDQTNISEFCFVENGVVKSYNCYKWKYPNIEIDDAITEIDSMAFQNYGVESIHFFESKIIKIGDRAFENCKQLKSISYQYKIPLNNDAYMENEYNSLPNTIKEIGEGAFCGCTSLDEIKLPYGIKKIPNYLFKDCRSLFKVEIPETVTLIGIGAFQDCKQLSKIFYQGKVEQWKKIKLCNDSIDKKIIIKCIDGQIVPNI